MANKMGLNQVIGKGGRPAAKAKARISKSKPPKGKAGK